MLGFGEMTFLFVLALLVFGPKKLPEIARQVGKAMNEFKKASNEFRSQIESEISNLERETSRNSFLLGTSSGCRRQRNSDRSAACEHVPAQLTSSEPASEPVAKAPDA